MSGARVSPSQQARRDREKSKLNPVKSLKDMTPEERQAAIDTIMGADRERARRQALKDSGMLPHMLVKGEGNADEA